MRVVAKARDYRARTPILSVVANANNYEAKTPALRIIATTTQFRAAMPVLRVVAVPENQTGTTQPKSTKPGAIIGDVLDCAALLECSDPADIARIEADLRSLGYTYQNYPFFCRDVAQSLGTCAGATADSDGPSASGDRQSPVPPGEFATQPGGAVPTPCPELEKYAIALQNRADAGEDTDAEEQRLQFLILGASGHIMNGRADLWCDRIVAGLP